MSVQGIGTESDPAVPCKGLAPFSLFFRAVQEKICTSWKDDTSPRGPDSTAV